MSSPISRRSFVIGAPLGAAAVGAATFGDFGFLDALPRLSAAAAPSVPATVQLSPDVEPLVRLIEDTPRADLVAKVADEVRKGTDYERLLAATFLAGVRGIQPRPVGFKFHAVLVINSAHLASLAAPDRDRWLPLFWAIDNFKVSQAANKAQGDWMMSRVAEANLPPAHQARERFVAAMDGWNEEAADRAVVALVRGSNPGEVFELLWRYGARDFRDIGHKAIYVANAWRTLQAIGWRHAEPVLRSLVYALLEHEGASPAGRDDYRDRPGRDNLRTARDLASRRGGTRSVAASTDLLSALRTATPAEASTKVADLLLRGTHPDSLWDGVFLRCGELLMQQPGIGGLHTVTTANALHHAAQTTTSDETRVFVLLQAAAFLPLFKQFMSSRGPRLRDLHIDTLEKAEVPEALPAAVEEVFADLSRNPLLAARKVLALLEKDSSRALPLMATARRLIFAKGRDSHDYKFSSAALEDYFHVAPELRLRFAAASMFWLKGSGAADNDLIRRTRAALAKG